MELSENTRPPPRFSSGWNCVWPRSNTSLSRPQHVHISFASRGLAFIVSVNDILWRVVVELYFITWKFVLFSNRHIIAVCGSILVLVLCLQMGAYVTLWVGVYSNNVYFMFYWITVVWIYYVCRARLFVNWSRAIFCNDLSKSVESGVCKFAG